MHTNRCTIAGAIGSSERPEDGRNPIIDMNRKNVPHHVSRRSWRRGERGHPPGQAAPPEHRMTCCDVDYERTRNEALYDLHLIVRNAKGLGLRNYGAEKLLEGESAYEAEGHGSPLKRYQLTWK